MSRKIQDPSHQRKKRLKISTTVYGREKIGNRVVYHVDNNDESSPKKNAESVVLYRWNEKNAMVIHLVARRLIQKSGAIYPLFLVIILENILI